MNWRRLSFWRMTLAMSRGALEYSDNQHPGTAVLRNPRTRTTYQYRYHRLGGYIIRRLPEP